MEECYFLVKLQAKSMELYWKKYSSMDVFYVFKLYKWCQLAQNITYVFRSKILLIENRAFRAMAVWLWYQVWSTPNILSG